MAPENGTGSPVRNLTAGTAPADPRVWNTSNHGGTGQVVAFADGHTEFVFSPQAETPLDNIWTASGAVSSGPSALGGVAASRWHGPVLTATKGPYDIVMYPVRNASTGGM